MVLTELYLSSEENKRVLFFLGLFLSSSNPSSSIRSPTSSSKVITSFLDDFADEERRTFSVCWILVKKGTLGRFMGLRVSFFGLGDADGKDFSVLVCWGLDSGSVSSGSWSTSESSRPEEVNRFHFRVLGLFKVKRSECYRKAWVVASFINILDAA